MKLFKRKVVMDCKQSRNFGIEYVIKAWKDEKHKEYKTFQDFPIFYNVKKKTIIFFTTRPGLLIGLHGKDIEHIEKMLKDNRVEFNNIEIVELKTFA